MRIVVFTSGDASIPAGQRCVARLRAHFPAAGKRKAGEDWCPIVFHGADEATVRGAAEVWIAEQIAAERAKEEARQRRAEAMRQVREARSAAR